MRCIICNEIIDESFMDFTEQEDYCEECYNSIQETLMEALEEDKELNKDNNNNQ